MPQLLHYLRVDRRTIIAQQKIDSEAETGTENGNTLGEMTNEKKEALQLLLNKTDEDIDWGTIDIYTCTASCSKSNTPSHTDSAYIEETTYVQKPLSFERPSQKNDKILEKKIQPVSEPLDISSSPSNIDLAKEIDL
jgi:hypothetical protein